jgi:hypothetical protein
LTEREQRVALLARQYERLRVLATCKFSLGGFELAKSIFPLGFEAPRNQPIVGIDRPITALGALCAITCTLDVTPELGEGGLMVSLELFAAFNDASRPAGASAARNAAATAASIWQPPTFRQYSPRPLTIVLPAQW